MLSEEKIENAKQRISKAHNDICFGTLYSQEENEKDEKILLQYIEQLESDKQKIIEKLEAKIEMLEDLLDLCKTDGRIAKYRIQDLEEEIIDLKEILSMIKGEKDES